jgi:hypothetical protein
MYLSILYIHDTEHHPIICSGEFTSAVTILSDSRYEVSTCEPPALIDGLVPLFSTSIYML